MRFLRGLSKSAWVIVGLVAGLVIAPAAAVAATAAILHGANGPAVNATNASQLLTAEAPPSSSVSVFGFVNVAGQCSNLPTANATGGFVVRQIDILVDVNDRSGTFGTAEISEGPGCNANRLFAEAAAGEGTVVLPFTPGIALPKNGVISVRFEGAAAGLTVDVHGYKVPASDAPAYSPVIRCSHAASACG
jgi:hypothetical protein